MFWTDLHSVRELLTSCRLIHDEKTVTIRTGTATTATAASPVPRSDHLSASTCFVQLWPVYEYLGLLKELSHVLSVPGEGGDEMEGRLRLQDFHLHCSPAAQCYHVCGEQVGLSAPDSVANRFHCSVQLSSVWFLLTLESQVMVYGTYPGKPVYGTYPGKPVYGTPLYPRSFPTAYTSYRYPARSSPTWLLPLIYWSNLIKEPTNQPCSF